MGIVARRERIDNPSKDVAMHYCVLVAGSQPRPRHFECYRELSTVFKKADSREFSHACLASRRQERSMMLMG